VLLVHELSVQSKQGQERLHDTPDRSRVTARKPTIGCKDHSTVLLTAMERGLCQDPIVADILREDRPPFGCSAHKYRGVRLTTHIRTFRDCDDVVSSAS
jgi:hypothetical protein